MSAQAGKRDDLPPVRLTQAPHFTVPPEYPTGGATVYMHPDVPSTSDVTRNWFRRMPNGGTVLQRDGGEESNVVSDEK